MSNSKGKFRRCSVGLLGIGVWVVEYHLDALSIFRLFTIFPSQFVDCKHNQTGWIRNVKKMLEFVMLSEETDIAR